MLQPWKTDQWLPGVLNRNQMEQLVDGGHILGVDDFEEAVDHSSIDLRLSDEGYEMVQGSIKPTGERSYIESLKDSKFAQRLPTKKGCFELLDSHCYVFRLKERLSSSLSDSNIYGQATAKSSVGRVDVIARLIIDGMYKYESMEPSRLTKATDQMFLEIVPISFNVRVKEGISLSQLRFSYGKFEDSVITDKEFIKSVLQGSDDGEGYLSVDLSNITVAGHKVAAFRARELASKGIFVDLWEKPPEEKPDPCEFWCFDKSENNTNLNIRKGEFYLLRSAERISLPRGVAIYCRPMDETLGEMRIHYAGFVHPYFGMKRKDTKRGTPLIFEVRCHNVDITLAHREKLAKLIFYRMSEVAPEPNDKEGKKKTKKYERQELNLSDYFQEWPDSLILEEDGIVRRG